MKRVCVTGAGGFIGGHLCRYLKEQGHWVRGVDIKVPFQETNVDEFEYFDLRHPQLAARAVKDVDWIFALAADKGGAGYISWAHADIILNSTAIDLNTIRAAIEAKVGRLLFTSSVCVYPTHLLESDEPTPLREKDSVYPAQPEGGYGWEKLHAEHLCHYVREAEMLDTCVARLHNCYGPYDTWDGVKAKAPAALCRKVARSKITGGMPVEIWGNGKQVRSFMYAADCVVGLVRLMESDFPGPLNIGHERAYTVDELVDTIMDVAGHSPDRWYNPDGPTGVGGRMADNTLCREVLDWEPTISLREGMEKTYPWIERQVKESMRHQYGDGGCTAK